MLVYSSKVGLVKPASDIYLFIVLKTVLLESDNYYLELLFLSLKPAG
jgi:hypothetical protein